MAIRREKIPFNELSTFILDNLDNGVDGIYCTESSYYCQLVETRWYKDSTQLRPRRGTRNLRNWL